jgi:hypothetical protein
VLAHWNKSPLVDMSLHSDTSSWFWASQSGIGTHDLPHSSQVRYPLQGRTQRGAHPAPKIGKNMIFWRKIVIFHTKYPKNVRPLPPQLDKIRFFGVKSWFFTRNTPTILAPPSARCNFSDYTTDGVFSITCTFSKKWYGCTWTWVTIQHYT